MFKWIYELADKLKETLSEKGQGMVEYGIVLAVVAAIAAIVFWGGGNNSAGLQSSVQGAYNSAVQNINNAGSRAASTGN